VSDVPGFGMPGVLTAGAADSGAETTMVRSGAYPEAFGVSANVRSRFG
jgi:hypothetical protein